MKVYRRKFAHRNLLVFILLSFAYLLVVYAFSRGGSVFSKQIFASFLVHNAFLLLLFPLVIYSVFLYKNYAKYLLFFFLAITLISSFVLLSASFNKLVLALNFAYALYAFYFFTAWEIERSEAGYNPQFSERDLEKQSRFSMQGIVYSGDRSKNEKIFLTNIDEKSCFVLFEANAFEMKEAILEIIFEGVLFSSKVILVSKYDKGAGFSFIDSGDSHWSLQELCKICRQRGLFLT